jgi:iron complex transport system substrate-binding protein
MRIRFKKRVQGSGFRVQGRARWRFAVVGLVLWAGVVLADDEIRVISLAPHLTELAFAAGGGERLVGVVDWSDYPPEASKLPSIGDAFRFDLERIMSLSPDLALAWTGGTPPALAARLDSLGIETLWIETSNLDQISTALETLGQALGAPGPGRAAAADLRARLAELVPPAAPDQTAFYQVSPRPLYTLGGRHVINEVFAHCGLVNVFADLDAEAAVVDLEAVLARSPDLIIVGSDSAETDGAPAAIWHQTHAARQDRLRVYRVDPTLLIRPTPRIVDGIEKLCGLAAGD